MTYQILVVDDEPDILTLTKVRLQKSGYTVLTAIDGEEALKLLEKERPDLILLDLILPNIQGDEVCKKIKKHPKWKTIPVILFSASCTEMEKKQKSVGADGFIIKPFEPKEFLETIRKAIKK